MSNVHILLHLIFMLRPSQIPVEITSHTNLNACKPLFFIKLNQVIHKYFLFF